MGTPTLFLIALGLSMDAFAVSISNGMCYRGFGRKQAAAAAFSFGLFQMLMPIIGYLAGRTFSDAISAADHWIALLLLGFIGGKMVFDGVRELRHPEGWAPPTISSPSRSSPCRRWPRASTRSPSGSGSRSCRSTSSRPRPSSAW